MYRYWGQTRTGYTLVTHRNSLHILCRIRALYQQTGPISILADSPNTLENTKSTPKHVYRSIHRPPRLNMSTTSQGRGGEFRLFEGKAHAESYALYRPTYTPQVYQAILDYCRKAPDFSFDFAIDIACGTGQSTRPLKEYFKRVLGTDISPNQVELAKKQVAEDGILVDYAVGKAEDLGDVAPRSVDLITCAQSFHWFDHGKVYAEARRVLKPKTGVFAVYGYGNVRLSLESASDIVQKFFSETLGGYWPPERDLVTTCYAGRSLELADFSRVDDLEIHRRMPLPSLIGYLSSWSAYRGLLKDHPQSTVLDDVKQGIIEEYNKAGETTQAGDDLWLDVSWPVYILLGRNA